MDARPRVFSLKGVVQHYSWGGFDFIPQLLRLENKERQPYAEYWLGAHPNHPSRSASDEPLSELIERSPKDFLGEDVAQRFPSLPYLLKLLDVRQMLSIQVHPDKKSAEAGFETENAQGIAVNAGHRNYKDRNHKPELMVALSDFWLLHGFKKEDRLLEVLSGVPELNFLLPFFENGDYKRLYEQVMQLPQAEVNSRLEPLLQRIAPLYKQQRLSRHQEDFWAARAALNFGKDGHHDRGIFSIYLFNLVELRKGEGIFQPAGMPHAYLEGLNVEVMANSDNVLRAGLTDKYIDVKELMKHVRFEATRPQVLRPLPESGHKVFASPAEEFELHQYQLDGQEVRIASSTAETFLLVEGTASWNGQEMASGEALLALPGSVTVFKGWGPATLFRVTVPAIKKPV